VLFPNPAGMMLPVQGGPVTSRALFLMPAVMHEETSLKTMLFYHLRQNFNRSDGTWATARAQRRR
jgi:hypothetical protein